MDNKKITLSFIILLIIICILNLNGKVSYGRGLGDVFYSMGNFILILIITPLAINFRNNGKSFSRLNWALLFFLIYIFLKLTFWRGPEMPWDGTIFLK